MGHYSNLHTGRFWKLWTLRSAMEDTHTPLVLCPAPPATADFQILIISSSCTRIFPCQAPFLRANPITQPHNMLHEFTTTHHVWLLEEQLWCPSLEADEQFWKPLNISGSSQSSVRSLLFGSKQSRRDNIFPPAETQGSYRSFICNFQQCELWADCR